MQFQSLFQWILLSNYLYIADSNLIHPRFQSLFQWILLSNPIPFLTGKDRQPVSILVLVDLARELQTQVDLKRKNQVSILVLVDLARELSKVKNLKSPNKMFQSLFQWILLSNKKYKYYIHADKFQSLFQWILLSNVRHSNSRLPLFVRVSFNPCFSGSCSRIPVTWMTCCIIIVSILVLVDLALE